MPFTYSQYSSGAVQTPAGISVVFASQGGLRCLHCDGGCDTTSRWSAANLFRGAVRLDHTGAVRFHDTPLAADAAGGLHLLFLDDQDGLLHYASCSGSCGTQASWQDVGLNSSASALTGSARLIAVASGGALHVLYGSSAGRTHATCSANCLDAANWSYVVIGGSSIQGGLLALALAFGPDGRLNVACADQSTAVTYATCGAPCSVPGAWSVAALPLTTSDVGLAVDPAGQVYLATIGRTVVVSRCAASVCRPHRLAVRSRRLRARERTARDRGGRDGRRPGGVELRGVADGPPVFPGARPVTASGADGRSLQPVRMPA